MTIKSAALYARVSTTIQAEHGHSLESQLAACREKAAEVGAIATREYVDDGYSGAYLERPALDNLRDALRDHLHDAVIVYDPDRLSRNLAHQLLLTEEIEKLGARLIFCSTELKDTPEGRMLYQMRGVFAAYEREKFRERSMRGKRSMARKGLIAQDSHVFGYDYDKENRRYVVNEAEAETVRLIFDLYVSRKIGGTYQLANYLNEHNIPSPAGRRWHIESVRQLLTRKMYGGEYYYGRYYHTKKDATHEVRIPRPESDWVRVDCPAIVPMDTVNKAISIMDENTKKRTQNYASKPLLLQGLVYCPSCGQKCIITAGEKDVSANDGTRRRYYYCKARNRQHKCKARMLFAPDLDSLVWNAIETICKSRASLAEYIGQTKAARKPRKKDRKKEVEEKLSRLASERQTILSWFSQNLIAQSEATAKLQTIKAREEALQKTLDEKPEEPPEPYFDVDQIVNEVQSCPLDFDSKRRLLLSIIDKVYAIRTDNNMFAPVRINIRIQFKSYI